VLAARNALYKSKLESAEIADPQWKHKVALGRFADKALLNFAYNQLSLSCFSAYIALGAVVSGDLDKLQWLRLVKGATMFRESSVVAAQYGHTNILNWFYQIRFHIDAKTSREAAFQGHLDILQLLHANAHRWHVDTCLFAVKAGHLAVLQWLGEHGCAYEIGAMTQKAAYYGKVNVLDWLLTQAGAQLSVELMQAAAKGGQLAMCQHLRNIGCAWDESACNSAAEHGHVHVLSWLRASGCPSVYMVLATFAAGCGRVAMKQYIIEQRVLQNELTLAELLTVMLMVAGVGSKLADAKWLRQQGAEWPAVLSVTMDNTIWNWQGDVLAWARANGCTSPIQ
jgi:hypothetical protein